MWGQIEHRECSAVRWKRSVCVFRLCLEPTDGARPRERIEIILHAQHRRRVDGLSMEDAIDQLATTRQPENLGEWSGRFVALEACDSAWREDEHPVPTLSSQHLLPRIRDHVELVPRRHVGAKDGRRCIAYGQPLAIVSNPLRIGDADAGGGAIPCEYNIVLRVRLRKVREDAVLIGRDLKHLWQFELFDGISIPRLAKGLPVAHVDGALAEHIPHDHLHRTRVRGRHQTYAVVGRQPQQLMRLGAAALELGLADGGAVGAAEARLVERLNLPTRTLRARARTKVGTTRPRGWLGSWHRQVLFWVHSQAQPHGKQKEKGHKKWRCVAFGVIGLWRDSRTLGGLYYVPRFVAAVDDSWCCDGWCWRAEAKGEAGAGDGGRTLLSSALDAGRGSRESEYELIWSGSGCCSSACVQCLGLTGACAACSHYTATAWELSDLDHSHAATPQRVTRASCAQLLRSVLGAACR